MKANAVISADRRYVRITALPFFSSIKGVVQYNMQSGVTDQAESDTAFQNLDINIDQDGGQDGGADGGGGGGNVGTLAVAITAPITTIFTFIRGGSVSRSGDLTEALAVTLTSGNITNLVVPAAVVIPAGESIASFDVTGGVTAGSTTITATALGLTAVATVNVPP